MNKKRPLTPTEAAECRRLKLVYAVKKQDLKITQEEIADAMGISQSAVSHYLNGINALNLEAARKFSKLLNVEIEEFSPRLARELNTIREDPALYVPSREEIRHIPVISWVRAGELCDAIDNLHPGDAEDWIYSSARRTGPRSFALQVVGDSMTNPYPNSPSYPHGTIIVCDPDKRAEIGSRVIAKRNDEVTFKVYTKDAGQHILKPLNPQYPIITMDDTWHVCAVVTSRWIDE